MLWRQRTLVLAVAGLLTLVCVCGAEAQGRRGQDQPGGGPPPGGFGGPARFGGGMMGGFGRGASEAMLLGREDVQKELVLEPEQLAELAKLRDNSDMRAMFEKVRDLPEAERMTKVRELMEAAQKKTQAQIDKILIGPQAERLKQLAVQFQMRGGGAGLASDDVAEKLGIPADQREKLRTKARELELQARKKLLDDLLKELTPEQQAKYKELVGEPFEFKQDERFGPGGRGPGGPARRSRRQRAAVGAIGVIEPRETLREAKTLHKVQEDRRGRQRTSSMASVGVTSPNVGAIVVGFCCLVRRSRWRPTGLRRLAAGESVSLHGASDHPADQEFG